MKSPENRRPTWAEISLESLKHNYREIKKHLHHGTQLMAVVKADAYGHGAGQCAIALESAGADWFGVALIEEGIELRRAGVKRPILCIGGFWKGQAADVIEHDLTAIIFRLDAAEELNARAEAAGVVANYHLKIDTGMGRLGVPFDDAARFARELKKFDRLKLDGVMTHFADADGDNPDYTELQIDKYEKACEILRDLGFDPLWRHLANSAGIHAYPRSHGNLARAGATLYGLSRDVLGAPPDVFDLWPVMSLRTRIVMLKTVSKGVTLGYGRTFEAIRDSRIATLPIGYADGLRRALSNRGGVLIRGQFAPIAGRISMDLTIVDVTDIADVGPGDEVILIGVQGNRRISAEDMAEEAGTISYEIVTGISSRVPRVYV